MKKQRSILLEEDAVSPVIGVILMVAITVILAAVIGTFVLGLGDQVSQTAPQASVTMSDADAGASSVGDTSSPNLIDIKHGGGDTIQQDETTINVNGPAGSADIWTGSAVNYATVEGEGVDLIIATSPTQFSTADTMTVQAQLSDDDTDSQTDVDLSGEYTVTIIDDQSGQIVAEDTVDVS